MTLLRQVFGCLCLVLGATAIFMLANDALLGASIILMVMLGTVMIWWDTFR